jgi:photosystem II stability/assembly factor-like uncharacterized protein
MNGQKIKILIILYSIFVTQLMGQWEQSTGTSGLDTQALFATGNSIFMGGATGTYRSLDEGQSFELSNSGNDSIGPTRGFTSDSLYIYTCTSQGVYRSENNGVTWEQKSNGIVNLLSHGIININSRLVHVSPGGISISVDHGENWTSAGLTGTDVRCVTHIQDTLFVGTNGQGLYKSGDWGETWIEINNGLSSTRFRAIQSKGNTLFAGGGVGSGVFRSTDYGTSWELLLNGITSSSYRGFASNNNLIVAGSFTDGVFYSLDNGDSWSQINEGLLDLNIFDLELSNNYIIAGSHTQGVFRFDLSTIIITPTVTNPITGRTWMDRNLGASQVATSYTDELAYGDLYQWGRLSDGHESRTSTTTNNSSSTDDPRHSLFILASNDWRSPANDSLWQGVDGINNPCPSGFRLPTEAEFDSEFQSWASSDAAGAFNSPLKLTLTGARSRMSGQIGNVGTFAGYRTSTVSGVASRVMGISINNALMGTRERADGNCIRCIKDETELSNINETPTLAVSFKVYDNFPNPFNPTTTLQYDLPEDATVKIMIYDLMGREVKTLVNNQQTAGFKSIIWNASNNLGQPVSAGMYLYRISAGDFHSVKKMILLK